MDMRLLPAMLGIILLFLAGLLFLKMRESSAETGTPWRLRGLLRNQRIRTMAILFLILLLALLFKVMGKIALVIAVVIILLSLLTFKKA